MTTQTPTRLDAAVAVARGAADLATAGGADAATVRLVAMTAFNAVMYPGMTDREIKRVEFLTGQGIA